jgi:DNA polymerase-3 subunit delta'
MTWDVIGQDHAVDSLRGALEASRVAHAYLFVGPEHVGRATTARVFAQALNCEADGRPCNECRTCRLIAEDKHPDTEWVRVGGICDESDHRDHSSDNSRDIRICQIRHVERVISRTTVSAKHRVVIVDPADAMTVEATNAFLKTLEEPAPGTVIILITAREERLRETVRSRCRRIEFRGVPREKIAATLQERWGASAELAGRLARIAQGRVGWAVAALLDESLLAERERTLDDVESVLAGTLEERFSYASSLGSRFAQDPESVRSNLDGWCDWMRDVLVTAAGQDVLATASERLDTLRVHASQCGVAGAFGALTAVLAGRRHLEEHANAVLALEAMLLEVPQAR